MWDYAPKRIRPLVKCHGGKFYMCRRIIRQFPWHSVYIEPFLGGGSVLLNKQPSTREIGSDINLDLINAWEQVKQSAILSRESSQFETLEEKLRETLYCKEIFDLAGIEISNIKDPVMAAWAFICRRRMSRSGLGRDYAWSDRLRGKRSPTGPVPGEINSWNTFLNNDLLFIVQRCENIEFECAHWNDILTKHINNPHALLYLDPPYIKHTRTVEDAYGDHEMREHEHLDMLRVLTSRRCYARWFLSGYKSSLYDKILGDYPCYSWNMPNNSGQTKIKQRRVEALWTNCKQVNFKQVEIF